MAFSGDGERAVLLAVPGGMAEGTLKNTAEQMSGALRESTEALAAQALGEPPLSQALVTGWLTSQCRNRSGHSVCCTGRLRSGAAGV